MGKQEEGFRYILGNEIFSWLRTEKKRTGFIESTKSPSAIAFADCLIRALEKETELDSQSSSLRISRAIYGNRARL